MQDASGGDHEICHQFIALAGCQVPLPVAVVALVHGLIETHAPGDAVFTGNFLEIGLYLVAVGEAVPPFRIALE